MNLKSKDGAWPNKAFGYLIEPECSPKNDQELYAAVKANGRAVLRPFEGASYKLKTPIEVTPEQFESDWMGD